MLGVSYLRKLAALKTRTKKTPFVVSFMKFPMKAILQNTYEWIHLTFFDMNLSNE